MTEHAKARRNKGESAGVPEQSRALPSDIRRFVLHRPTIPTLMDSKSDAGREDYGHRIRQRLGLSVSDYAILNIHKIGIAAPSSYIFEELLDWEAVLRCWPGHIATLERVNERFEHLHVFLLGRKKKFLGLKYDLFGLNTVPLFTMKAIRMQRVPNPSDFDNARYLLYECSGGYPVGVFCIYVRSSIHEMGEVEQSQVFMVVSFNFYGKKSWPETHIVNAAWERIHNRVTANILNRFKQLCEFRIQAGVAALNAIDSETYVTRKNIVID
jgi:hypothetical protein